MIPPADGTAIAIPPPPRAARARGQPAPARPSRPRNAAGLVGVRWRRPAGLSVALAPAEGRL